MGIYLNPGDKGFWESIHFEIYVDKTGLIGDTNKCNPYGAKVYLCQQR
ncbi:hypothetical protein [Parablautia muri]|nr:hypothetical protein [Parablautia muri]